MPIGLEQPLPADRAERPGVESHARLFLLAGGEGSLADNTINLRTRCTRDMPSMMAASIRIFRFPPVKYPFKTGKLFFGRLSSEQ
jgi:hypothetical protein